MRFEIFVAARYLRGKRKTRFISLITFISVAGVSVGVTALIVVMSVMTGFDNALRETIIGNRSHLTVFNRAGLPLEEPYTVISELKALSPEILGAGPVMQMEALIKRGDNTTGAFVLGIDPELEAEVTDLPRNLTHEGGRMFGEGKMPGEKEIVLGFRLAHRLAARVGSEVAVMTDKPTVTPFGMRPGNQVFLTVSGISQAKMSDFDNLYAFVDIDTAQMLTGRNVVDGIHVRLTDAFLADKVSALIRDELPYRAETWYESQEAFFEALKQEKVAMFIILVFIVLVAAFNITSTLIMIVMEKQRDIGILRTLGTSGWSILSIFIVEGLLIGLTGTVIGLIFGVVLSYNINPVAELIAWFLGVDLFNSTIYYFDGIPVAIVISDLVWITVSAVLLTLVSTLYPAWSATRLNPVDALRYE
ncbi:MAG: lipoprotein-releasing ABC transporter permease subunit [Candidatus Hydrogenedentes bacterium]|nr:lipoprotein-releasing ABC transporter permease subunit [Candidatus Hydrogenedentota bacterium]